jgi:hypothetical protein
MRAPAQVEFKSSWLFALCDHSRQPRNQAPICNLRLSFAPILRSDDAKPHPDGSQLATAEDATRGELEG